MLGSLHGSNASSAFDLNSWLELWALEESFSSNLLQERTCTTDPESESRPDSYPSPLLRAALNPEVARFFFSIEKNRVQILLEEAKLSQSNF